MKTEPNYTTFILDCPPNMSGVLDAAVVTALGQVPQYWTPNTSRPPLPTQLPKIETPLTAVSARATSGDAALAVDGYNDSSKGTFSETLWKSSGALPQSVTIDLGQVYGNIDMLEYLPQRWTGTTNGNVTSYTISVSTDGSTFTEVTRGTWPVDPHYNGLLSPQRVQFEAQSARYVSFQADAVAGGGTEAIVGEVAVGSSETAIGDGGADGGDATFDAGAEGDMDATSDNRLADAFTSGGDVGWESEASRLVPAGLDGAAAEGGSRESSTGDATPDGSSRAGAASPSDAGCTCNVGETRGTAWGPAAIVACAGALLARGRRRKT